MADSARKKSILVLGAGELGNEVINALCNHPKRNDRNITILLRPDPVGNPDSATLARRDLVPSLQSRGVSVVRADITNGNEADLSQIFSKYSTVVGCTGMTSPTGTQLKLAKAVLAAEVDRYFPWQYGMDYDVIGRGSSQDLFSEQLDVRDLLRAQERTKWVIVSTGLFLSFLFVPAFGVVSEDRGSVIALGAWENEITFTTTQDIGKAVAELVLVDGEVGGLVHIAGETASYEQIAEYVEKEKGSEIRRELATVDQLDKELKSDPDNGMKKYRAVFAEGKGVAWPMEKTYNARKGMRFCGAREYLRGL
ncbi:hypothetical protein G7Y79_00047g083250 [Physcia stellaris]|nr:hypothetical protein G7Y79_00047g083250 [Physcia stellaris]